jgi:hypothetical protein
MGKPKHEDVSVDVFRMSVRRKDYHKPNTPAGYYSSAAKQGLTGYKVDLSPETVAAFIQAAERAGMSQRQAADYAFRAFAREQGINITPHRGRSNRSKRPKLDC